MQDVRRIRWNETLDQVRLLRLTRHEVDGIRDGNWESERIAVGRTGLLLYYVSRASSKVL